MIAVVIHFRSRNDALAAATDFWPRLTTSDPEQLSVRPLRPCVLVVHVPLTGGPGATPARSTMSELRRVAHWRDGEVDDARIEEQGVFDLLTQPLPDAVLDRFHRENAHLRSTRSESVPDTVQLSLF